MSVREEGMGLRDGVLRRVDLGRLEETLRHIEEYAREVGQALDAELVLLFSLALLPGAT